MIDLEGIEARDAAHPVPARLPSAADRRALLAYVKTLRGLLLKARNRPAREQRALPVETGEAIGREIAEIDAALDAGKL